VTLFTLGFRLFFYSAANKQQQQLKLAENPNQTEQERLWLTTNVIAKTSAKVAMAACFLDW